MRHQFMLATPEPGRSGSIRTEDLNLTFGPLRRIHRGTFGFAAAVLGTMFLGGDLWFESFAVPWLAEGPFPQVLSSDPSILFALGATSSYLLFAIGARVEVKQDGDS